MVARISTPGFALFLRHLHLSFVSISFDNLSGALHNLLNLFEPDLGESVIRPRSSSLPSLKKLSTPLKLATFFGALEDPGFSSSMLLQQQELR
ncbi:hypothetical protein HGRIS_001068 [Hohenbuehelia grisea]|uniref:Uncharacterized protein n=1 Tax=Hohenbuehelia grisea TaxID=104357 RepID=A0ABR3JN63_9AGAR